MYNLPYFVADLGLLLLLYKNYFYLYMVAQLKEDWSLFPYFFYKKLNTTSFSNFRSLSWDLEFVSVWVMRDGDWVSLGAAYAMTLNQITEIAPWNKKWVQRKWDNVRRHAKDQAEKSSAQKTTPTLSQVLKLALNPTAPTPT